MEPIYLDETREKAVLCISQVPHPFACVARKQTVFVSISFFDSISPAGGQIPFWGMLILDWSGFPHCGPQPGRSTITCRTIKISIQSPRGISNGG
jgi:hypothetical protein